MTQSNSDSEVYARLKDRILNDWPIRILPPSDEAPHLHYVDPRYMPLSLSCRTPGCQDQEKTLTVIALKRESVPNKKLSKRRKKKQEKVLGEVRQIHLKASLAARIQTAFQAMNENEASRRAAWKSKYKVSTKRKKV